MYNENDREAAMDDQDENDDPCRDCSSYSGANGLPDIEDGAVIAALRDRNAALEAEVARLKGSVSASSSAATSAKSEVKLRSEHWFDRPEDPVQAGLYLDRLLNFGLTPEEFAQKRPIIGIAQSGSDLAQCNRHHIVLAKRVREGIRTAGGIAIEFPTLPIQETLRRPSATLDRNLSYLTLVELLHGYPFDGVVLLTGCDKTTPACLMAAATVNIPAICMNVGPMLNGYDKHRRVGAGTVVWKARELHASGKLSDSGVLDLISSGTPSVGHCNTMGTASTMNALAETLGMALPGSAAIPAPYKDRAQCAYRTGLEIVNMVRADRRPSDIMTREAFENAIIVNTAIGGSTNAPIHLNAIAKHVGVKLSLDDWDHLGFEIPLLVNMQPAGKMLGEDYYRAGGLSAVVAELLARNKLHPETLNVNGKTLQENYEGRFTWDRNTIKSFDEPLKEHAGFVHLSGNLFDSAIMKLSVISDEFRSEFLQSPADPNAFESLAYVFDGPEDYHRRIDKHDLIDEHSILIMRGCGPLGYPGAAEVVNMAAPARLLKKGLSYNLPCIGDGRQSGTSASPSILNASPEAAENGNLAIVQDGDCIRVDLGRRRVDLLVSAEEIQRRRGKLLATGGYRIPASQTPYQDLFRREVGPLSEGMVMKRAVAFQRIAQEHPAPRDNH